MTMCVSLPHTPTFVSAVGQRFPFFARAGPHRTTPPVAPPTSQTHAPTAPARRPAPTPAPSSTPTPAPMSVRDTRAHPRPPVTKPKRPHSSRRPSPSNPQFPICLPQRATPSHHQHRRASLRAACEAYRWSYDAVADAALIRALPASENPNRRWVVLMKRMEDRCRKNTIAVSDVHRSPNTLDTCSDDTIAAITSPSTASPDPFHLYKRLFATIDLPAIAKDNAFLRDDVFGWYRVAGPNPMQLRRVPNAAELNTLFPELTDRHFQGVARFDGDSLSQALSERRLYLVNYAELEALRAAPGGKQGMHLYAPTALLAVPSSNADTTTTTTTTTTTATASAPLPIAIRCGQDPSQWPLTTANHSHTSQSTWLAAKHAVQVADAFAHEAVHHFARTHLLMEAFVCASHRTLADTHPVMRLLQCHFEGTAFINSTSLTQLLCEGGMIDRLTAPPIAATREFAANALVGDFSFDETMPDKELAARGVVNGDAESEASPLCFPYRDDALVLWDAILEWVHSYLGVFYAGDDDVRGDNELQAWGREVVWSGRIGGFGETTDGGLKTLDYLTRAIAMVIFTASVQHAAVNFPQATHMQFAPAMPLAAFAHVNDGLLRMMPSVQHAEEQLCAAEMLGVVRYTRLGDYGSALAFGGAAVEDALARFRVQLDDLQSRIEHRSIREQAQGLHAYDFLAPSNIPQSINV